MDRRQGAGIACAVAAYACWGLLSPVSKRLLEDFEPLGVNAVRFVIAVIVVLPWLGREGVRGAMGLLRRPAVLWVNLLANVSLTLFLYSLTRLEPTFSTLGFYSAPLWTAMLASVVLRERIGAWFAPAVLGLFVGGYLTLFGLAAPGAGFESVGMALALASAVVWAWYTVDLRRLAPGLDLKPLMGANLAFAAAYYVVLALAFEGMPEVRQGAATWGWVALHVAFPTVGAFVLFNAAVQRAPVGPVNILIAMELAFTVLFAWLLFGEDFSAVQLLGLGIALAAVSGYLWARLRRSTPPSTHVQEPF